jgi:hypothetical protein
MIHMPRNDDYRGEHAGSRYPLKPGLVHLAMLPPEYRRPKIPMTKQPKPEKWQRDLLDEEHPSDSRWNVRKGIPHTTDDQVLKRRCPLHKSRSLLSADYISLTNKGQRQFYHLSPASRSAKLCQSTVMGHIPTYSEMAASARHTTASRKNRLAIAAAAPRRYRTRGSPSTTLPRGSSLPASLIGRHASVL